MSTKKPQLPKTAPKKTGKAGIGPKPDAEELKVPKQKDLPGMENKHLEDLEDAARKYAAIRDRRMALTEQEVDSKELLHTLMKRHGKTLYRVAEMEIKIIAKEETVKVRILEDKDE